MNLPEIWTRNKQHANIPETISGLNLRKKGNSTGLKWKDRRLSFRIKNSIERYRIQTKWVKTTAVEQVAEQPLSSCCLESDSLKGPNKTLRLNM